MPPSQPLHDRQSAYAFATRDGFRPDRIHIRYSRRVIGGLFGGNISFADHPVATRLFGDYPVVTVRSILRYLQDHGHALRKSEWRDGRLQATPGPA